MYFLPCQWGIGKHNGVAGEAQCFFVIIEVVDVIHNSGVCDAEIFISETVRLFNSQPTVLKLLGGLLSLRLLPSGCNIGHDEMHKSRLMGRNEPFQL